MKRIIKLYLAEQGPLLAAFFPGALALSAALAFLERDLGYLYLGGLFLFVGAVGAGAHFYRSIPLYRSILAEICAEEDFFVQGSSPLAEKERERIKKIRGVYSGELNALRKENENYKVFMSNWVHQMKTPLSVLNLMTQEKELVSSEALEEEISRMDYLLNQILQLIRMDRIRNDFIVERCQLAALVRAAVNEQKNYFIKKEIFPRMNISDSIYVYTDKKWFSFALQQFLNNAIKYSSPGQGVQIDGETENRKAVLKIQDQGPGILPQDLPRVFDFCYTGNNGREKQKESSGLGLYIAKNILDYLEHEITLHSEPGQGTTVRICLRTEGKR